MARHSTSRRSASRTSRRIREASIGTHVGTNTRRAKESKVRFSNPRTAAATGRSTIDQMVPETSTREDEKSYSARRKRKGLTEKAARKTHIRNLIIGIAIGIVVLIAAAGVAWLVFTMGVSSKMALSDDAAKAALVAPATADDPYYVLVEGEFNQAGVEYAGPDLLMLVRVDASANQATIISIPSKTQVMMSDGQYHDIPYAQVIGGDAALVSAVATFADVPISHIFKTDSARFVELVDALGGITVDVPQDIDDPEAGSYFIEAGTRELSGEQALVMCRADNYVEQVESRANNQRIVLVACVEKMLQREGFDRLIALDAIADCFSTDMNFDRMNELCSAFSAGDTTVYTGTVPGSLSVDVDGVFFNASAKSWTAMMDEVSKGQDPSLAASTPDRDPSTITVTVQNGAGIDGAGSQAQGLLQQMGYQVPTMGNADTYMFKETLVVYKDDALISSAESLVGKLQCGRAIDGSVYYSFDTDLLLIIGADWKPLN